MIIQSALTKRIANIILLARIKNKHRVEFDSEHDNIFTVHKNTGKVQFEEIDHGLYYHDTNNITSSNTFVMMVRDNSERYTRQKYIAAKNTRTL